MYAPGVENRSGEILAGGISNFMNSITGAMDYNREKKKEDTDNLDFLKGIQTAYDNDPSGMMKEAFGPDFDAAHMGVKGVAGVMQGIQTKTAMQEQAIKLMHEKHEVNNRKALGRAANVFMNPDAAPEEIGKMTFPQLAMSTGYDGDGQALKLMAENFKGARGYRKVDVGDGKTVMQDAATGDVVPTSDVSGDKPKEKTLPAELTQKMSLLRQVITGLGSLESQYDKVKDKIPTGPVAGRLLSPFMINDPDFQQLNALSTQLTPALARGVFGEVGVLTDKDMERYASLLPNAKASPAVASKLLEGLKAKVFEALKQNIDTADRAGYDMKEFQDLLKINGPGDLSPAKAKDNANVPAGKPKPGETYNGFRFLGGDPKKQQNWVAIE